MYRAHLNLPEWSMCPGVIIKIDYRGEQHTDYRTPTDVLVRFTRPVHDVNDGKMTSNVWCHKKELKLIATHD
jgi:hypothetical protein